MPIHTCVPDTPTVRIFNQIQGRHLHGLHTIYIQTSRVMDRFIFSSIRYRTSKLQNYEAKIMTASITKYKTTLFFQCSLSRLDLTLSFLNKDLPLTQIKDVISIGSI